MSPMTPATGPAASTTTSNVQLELRGARRRECAPRTPCVGGWVGRVWDADGRPRSRTAQMQCMELLRQQSHVPRRVLPA
eukprot:5053200-Prymnesium_polylepis.1